MDGNDQLAAQVLWQAEGEREWQRATLSATGNDRWTGHFTPQRCGLHRFIVEAWLDVWASFRAELDKKHRAGVATRLEVEEGRRLVAAAAQRSQNDTLQKLADTLASSDAASARELLQIGRASCREKGCQYVAVPVGRGYLKKKK